MASKIENIIHQAINTFRRPIRKPFELFQHDLANLETLVNEVTVNDLDIPKNLLRKNNIMGKFLNKPRINPVEYVPVYEDTDVSIGVFIVKHGARLPLHDHPSMYGFLKVLQGSLNVTSYTVVEEDPVSKDSLSSFYYGNPLKVIKHPEALVSKHDSACVLTPTDRNIHEVHCIDGPVAFLDVLSPPYDEDDSLSSPTSCHYFKVLKPSEDGLLRVIQINCPGNYWRDQRGLAESQN